jgi:hypothetical protein
MKPAASWHAEARVSREDRPYRSLGITSQLCAETVSKARAMSFTLAIGSTASPPDVRSGSAPRDSVDLSPAAATPRLRYGSADIKSSLLPAQPRGLSMIRPKSGGVLHIRRRSRGDLRQRASVGRSPWTRTRRVSNAFRRTSDGRAENEDRKVKRNLSM